MAFRISRVIFGTLTIACIGGAFQTAAAANLSPRLKPGAPEPVYLSSGDHYRLKLISDATEKKQWSLASAQLGKIEDPVAQSLGQWFYYTAAPDKINLSAVGSFLDAHPEWPSVSRIQSAAEKEMTSATPKAAILDFFATREPRTGTGKIQLARALFAKGENERGEVYLRDAWVNNNFKLAQERTLLANYAPRLRTEDHVARVDRLLWARQVTNAKRVFKYLPSKERLMADARAALLLQRNDGAKLYDSLPSVLRSDPGVMHAAVRHFRRKKQEARAVAIAKRAPADAILLRNPERWWYERQLLMRWALKEGRFTDAYDMAAGHGLTGGTGYSEAEFDAGWIALRFLKAPERASVHFEALTAAVSSPISLSRGYYWLGRSAEAQKDEVTATARYEQAAQHIYSFYGQLAAEKIGGGAALRGFSPEVVSSATDKANFEARAIVKAMRMLTDLDRPRDFLVFSYAVDDRLETPGEFIELAKLTNEEGAPHLTVRAGKAAVRRNSFTAQVAYPLISIPEEAAKFVAPEIVLGLSRQESEFNPRAYSRAGARGMMQLIPSTAKLTARKEGMRYSRAGLLDDPSYNMTLGSAHLSHLIEKYDGSLIMTFAAYNAGPHRVTQWVDRYGDPRSPAIDPVDWVELIPFSETRNYVQRVLENTQIYRARLGEAPIAGRLAADLERGGPIGRTGKIAHSPPNLRLAAANLGAQKLPPLPDRTAPYASAPTATPKMATPVTYPVDPLSPASAPEAGAATTTAPGATPAIKLEAKENHSPTTQQPQPEPTPALASPRVKALPPATPQAEKSTLLETPDATDTTLPAASPEEFEGPQPTPVQTITPSAAAPSQLSESPLATPMTPSISLPKNIEAASAPATDDCIGYRTFIAETAEDEDADETAGDLNAGMLAELQSGGCQ